MDLICSEMCSFFMVLHVALLEYYFIIWSTFISVGKLVTVQAILA